MAERTSLILLPLLFALGMVILVKSRSVPPDPVPHQSHIHSFNLGRPLVNAHTIETPFGVPGNRFNYMDKRHEPRYGFHKNKSYSE
ncbi:unnamed protein product [Cyprideis torosa]|uniref:Uncharacterized protein n=1 Tax=Cyprideis torosa TaxID=163714 RepID=A0A7R8WPK8_9CRUS|nr:unnamed protein product [Cyprideis torosa]CAG0900869.1 unnamed protein product [Cyprideis torosa]